MTDDGTGGIFRTCSRVALREEEKFVTITSKEGQFYGGDQAWFDWKHQGTRTCVARKGACGTVALANITAYLAETDPVWTGLYPYPDRIRDSFVSHMEQMYRYVAPYHIGKIPLGIWPVSRLARGMEHFARDRGIRLKAVWRDWAFSRENVLRYLAEGLKKNRPVAMLVGPCKLRQVEVTYPGGGSWKQDISLHWVTATGIELDREQGRVKIRVSTWGGRAQLDLDEYMQERFYAGLVYFE